MVRCKGIYGYVKKISTSDSTKISNYLSNPTLYPLTDCQKVAADVNGDGLITQTDVDFISNYILYGTGDQVNHPTGRTGEVFSNIGTTLCTGIYGDIGGIDIGDAQKVQLYLDYYLPNPILYPQYNLTDCQKIAADVDNDGLITTTDSDYIANYVSFPNDTSKLKGRTGQQFDVETCQTPTCNFTIL